MLSLLMFLISILLLITEIIYGQRKLQSQKLKKKMHSTKNIFANERFESEFHENFITELNELVSSTKALYYVSLATS